MQAKTDIGTFFCDLEMLNWNNQVVFMDQPLKDIHLPGLCYGQAGGAGPCGVPNI